MMNQMRRFIMLVEGNLSGIRKKISRIASRYGVILDAEIEYGAIIIVDFERPTSSPPGSGAAALKELQKLAQDNGMNIRFTPAEGAPSLIAYYMRLGFKHPTFRRQDQLDAYAQNWDENDPSTHDEGQMWF